jgi:hypothetical protein
MEESESSDKEKPAADDGEVPDEKAAPKDDAPPKKSGS